jgi:methylenetetrahydrofolate--tRNA-(uracil-5-)-methyltransferase
MITEEIEANPLITVKRGEVRKIPEGITIIATGPLTSDPLAEQIGKLTGTAYLHFFDAISPIIDGETIDMDRAFFGSRYMADADDYLNCPLTAQEYDIFYEGLIAGDKVVLREFEDVPYFEGCLPVEVMAGRGKKTLLYGPMKPVGLIDGHTGREPYGVIQLRREDAAGSMYNMVGFQTRLTYGEQDRVFRAIPALKNAQFLRYGSVHRNTYIHSPALLSNRLSLLNRGEVFFAGQITGVEGYMESTAMGLVAGISACFALQGKPFEPPPEETCIGAMVRYITTMTKDFQPMNMNFGLIKEYRKREKEKVIEKALQAISLWRDQVEG